MKLPKIDHALVTGGLGFVGSHLVNNLQTMGTKVTVIDDFSSGLTSNIDELSTLQIVEDDFASEKLSEILPYVDVVFHQAAQLEIFESLENPLREIETNVIKTVKLLELCRKFDVPKIVFASSACVYGETHYLMQRETDECRPQWPYGVSKLAAERYMVMYYELYRLKTVSLRYGIVYGPNEWFGRVLSIFAKRATLNLPLFIFGDGNQVRDFIHVKDVVEANIRAANSPLSEGHVFNIGTSIGTSINRVAKIIDGLTKHDIHIKYIDPKFGDMGRKRGEWRRMHLDCTLAEKKIKWKAKILLEEGLSSYLEWMRQVLVNSKKIYIPPKKRNLWNLSEEP